MTRVQKEETRGTDVTEATPVAPPEETLLGPPEEILPVPLIEDYAPPPSDSKPSPPTNEQAIADDGVLRKVASDGTIKNHTLASMGVGLVPLPLLDLAGITGVQLDMLYRLCKLYNVKFSRDLGKEMIASLVGGALPASTSYGLASLIKLVPIIGPVVSLVTMPALAGATTYALGKVFVQHLESGGTFLTFDPEKVREHFARELAEGKKVAQTLHKQ